LNKLPSIISTVILTTPIRTTNNKKIEIINGKLYITFIEKAKIHEVV